MSSVLNSKIIVKNTLFLYLQLIISMIISLYSARVVLNFLGVEDFGIYNVVGGVISLLTFLNTALANGIQRFITFELGSGKSEKLINIFKNALTIQGLLSLIVILLFETAGLWFLNYKMIIPPDRIFAANVIYQFAIVSFVTGIMQAPFYAVLIAHEKIKASAVINLTASVLRLLIVLFVLNESFKVDRLILYSVFFLLVDVIVFLLYILSSKRFDEVKIKFGVDKKLFYPMLSFSGWNMIGVMSYTLKDQGINMLLNVFFGPVVNAARSIAFQVFSAILSLVSNFQVAFRPQMIKSYAGGDSGLTLKLLNVTTKFSFFLIFTIALPILLEVDLILSIWLGNNVPELTSVFTRLIILIGMIDVFATPISIVVHATGKVKWYQLLTSICMLLVLPVSYIFLKNGSAAESVFIISLVITFCVQIIRLLVLRKLIEFSNADYFRHVILPVVRVVLIASIIPLLLHFSLTSSLVRLILVVLLSFIVVPFFVYLIGSDKTEKIKIKQAISKFLARFNTR